jgi:hypothetical protein
VLTCSSGLCNSWCKTSILFKYGVNVKWLNKLQKWVRHNKQKTTVPHIVCSQATVFRGTFPRFPWPHSLQFSSVGHLRTSACSATFDNEETLHQSCLIYWNLSQNVRKLWKGATVRGLTCPCVCWLGWRIFWTFVVKCGLINNINSWALTLSTCTLDVLRNVIYV